MIPRVLLLAEDRPDSRALGGVPVHVAALAKGASPHATMHAASVRGNSLLVESFSPRRIEASLHVGPDRAALEDALVAALTGLGTEVLHVHSPRLGPRAIENAVKRTGTRLVLTLHDHSLVCENYTLLEGGQRYCGIPDDLARCARCLSASVGRRARPLVAHRAAMGALVERADVVIGPTRSAVEHSARVHASLRAKARVIPWGTPRPPVRVAHSRSPDGPLRVAVVGVHDAVKGARVLPALVSACRELPVEWHLFGATLGRSQRELTSRHATVIRHGAYPRADLARRLDAARCHVVLLPSVFAETFSLVLSEVTRAGLPVIASDIAALGERVLGEGLGWTFDPFEPETLERLLTHLAKHPRQIDEVRERLAASPHRDETAMVMDHVAVWADLGRGAHTRYASLDDALHEFRLARDATVPTLGLERLAGRLSRSDFYRDLPLRRALPEALRKRIAHATTLLLEAGKGRRPR